MAGTVKVGIDRGCLRLQFPSQVSQKVWNVKQKYKSLGLSDTSINRVIAERLAAMAQIDIARDNLDPTLEKYNPFALEQTLEQIHPKLPGLLKLYTEYIETVIKPRVAPGTYWKYSGLYLKAIQHCPNADLVTDSVEIFDTVKKVRTPQDARRVLDVLYNLLEWCKRRKLVKENTPNPYRDYKQDVPGKATPRKPKHILKQGMVGDNDYRGYSVKEAEHIIEGFLYRGTTPGLYYNVASFLFQTGCRPGEAIGLEWRDISEDFTTLTFCRSYCLISKKPKGLKTDIYGKDKRIFPCGERLQKLLKGIYEKQGNPHPESLVFQTQEGNPIYWDGFSRSWAGVHGNFHDTNGVIETLIKERKVRFYLKPYATRHSFITWQLEAGMTPANVAKLVGNSPEMIYKYYVSVSEDTSLAFQF